MPRGKVQSHEPQLPLPPSQTPPPPRATPPAQRECISSLEYGQIPIFDLHQGDPLEGQIPEQAQDRAQEHIIFQIRGAETRRDGNQKVIPTTSNILKSNIIISLATRPLPLPLPALLNLGHHNRLEYYPLASHYSIVLFHN